MSGILMTDPLGGKLVTIAPITACCSSALIAPAAMGVLTEAASKSRAQFGAEFCWASKSRAQFGAEFCWANLDPQSSTAKHLAWLQPRWPRRVQDVVQMKAMYEYRMYRGPPCPLPDPHDNSISTRQWQKRCNLWVAQRREWFHRAFFLGGYYAKDLPKEALEGYYDSELAPEKRCVKVSALETGASSKRCMIFQ